jgi:hypothetical protein
VLYKFQLTPCQKYNHKQVQSCHKNYQCALVWSITLEHAHCICFPTSVGSRRHFSYMHIMQTNLKLEEFCDPASCLRQREEMSFSHSLLLESVTVLPKKESTKRFNNLFRFARVFCSFLWCSEIRSSKICSETMAAFDLWCDSTDLDQFAYVAQQNIESTWTTFIPWTR